MSAPFEVIAAPADVYVAATGAAFPLVDAAPASATWTLLGVVGMKDQSQDGVTVTNSQTMGEFTGAGGTVVRKRWRQAEGVTVAVTYADLSAPLYAMSLDAALTVTAPASATPGTSKFEMYRGTQVAAYALIVRGLSPFNDTMVAQYQVPGVHQMGNPAPKYSPAGPAELALEYHAFELVTGQLCQWVAQSAVHT